VRIGEADEPEEEGEDVGLSDRGEDAELSTGFDFFGV
jgi:hypothetical protein